MHSPRRSARPKVRGRPSRSANQPGKSPPTMSPSRVASDPARHQAQRDGIGDVAAEIAPAAAPPPPRIEQAEIILAALAHHHLLGLDRRVGIEPVELAVDLTLQVAGVGADPDRRLVLLGPERGRRDIAQRLAGAGAGLGQHRARHARHLAWRKGHRRRRGIVGLGGTFLGGRAQHLGQARAGLGRIDRLAAGGRFGRMFLPFRQTFPHLERAGRRLVARGIQRRQHRGPQGHPDRAIMSAMPRKPARFASLSPRSRRASSASRRTAAMGSVAASFS